MSAQSNAAPVIIKRKKVIKGGGHHGGAWKVAYADFVTAMMAFFLLMWLLNATTEQQRKGVADYFSPTIAINRVSGGGDGSFGGNSVFSEETLPQNGTGATNLRPTEMNQARGDSGVSSQGTQENAETEVLRTIEEALMGRGGESMASQEVLRHIVTRVTDEGLVIELFDLADTPLFRAGETSAEPVLVDLLKMLVEVSALVSNKVAISGFVHSQPVVIRENPVWELSAARANQTRILLGTYGMAPERIQRVTGHADRKPAVTNPMAVRNNRLEVTLLRNDVLEIR